jgi:hypothetical protein
MNRDETLRRASGMADVLRLRLEKQGLFVASAFWGICSPKGSFFLLSVRGNLLPAASPGSAINLISLTVRVLPVAHL